MRKALQQAVRVRDEYRCRYCSITEIDIGSTMTIDHIQPQRQSGIDELNNLVYCCHPCNEFKSKYWQTDPDLRLLNPLIDDMTEHYQEQSDGTLLALTERGTKHIAVLHLNRERLIAHRARNLRYSAREVYVQNVEVHVTDLEEEVRQLRRQLKKLFGDPDD